MKKILGILLVLTLVLSFSLVATTPVAAQTTWIVCPDGNGNYQTIDAAVASAAVLAGDTIELVAGDHNAGPISVDRDLTIRGQSKANTIIKPTQNAVNWFVIEAGVEFHLSEVTLDGAGYNIRAAIRTHGSGSISDTVIENIRYAQYLGWGIALTWSTSWQEWTISGNEFRNIERVGILVDGIENTASVSGNTFIGNGDGDWLQYGVEVGGGAYAEIDGNSISNYSGIESGWTSAGIYVHEAFDPGTEATITGNQISDCRYGVYVGYDDDTDLSEATITGNIFDDNRYQVHCKPNVVVDLEATLADNTFDRAVVVRGNPAIKVPTIFSRIEDAIDAAGPGDTIQVLAGTYPGYVPLLDAEIAEASISIGADASASTTNVSATATGGGTDTTVSVAEYVGNPTGVSPGFRSGAVYIDVHVGGTLPTKLVVEIVCPGTCSGVVLEWWDGDGWEFVTPTSVVNGKIQVVLSDASSPTIAQLTGTPFGLGSLSTVGWEGSSVSKAAVVAPWIALLATMMAGATLLMVRRRRAQI